jgi:hypothetical protein
MFSPRGEEKKKVNVLPEGRGDKKGKIVFFGGRIESDCSESIGSEREC